MVYSVGAALVEAGLNLDPFLENLVVAVDLGTKVDGTLGEFSLSVSAKVVLSKYLVRVEGAKVEEILGAFTSVSVLS